MTTLALRPMTTGDVGEILALEQRIFPRPWTEGILRDELAAPRRTYLVAEEDGVIVGYGGAMVVADEAHITNLAVVPEARGRGIASRIFLDLGTVKNLAEVTLNGKALGILWKPPFRVDVTEALKPGANHLEIAVTNLWPNRLIGDQTLPENERITWASIALYKADSPLLPSGLLGPVTISVAQEVKCDVAR